MKACWFFIFTHSNVDTLHPCLHTVGNSIFKDQTTGPKVVFVLVLNNKYMTLGLLQLSDELSMDVQFEFHQETMKLPLLMYSLFSRLWVFCTHIQDTHMQVSISNCLFSHFRDLHVAWTFSSIHLNYSLDPSHFLQNSTD